jgi:hypothetical protein
MIKNIVFLLLIIGCNSSPNNSERVSNLHPPDTISYFKTLFRSNTMTGTFDTLVALDYIYSNSDLFYAFNYPKLDRVNIGENIVELFNDTIRLRIEKTMIEPENQLTLSETEDYFKQSSGKRYFGVGVIWPKEKLSSFSIEINKVRKILTTDSFDDLLNPNLNCNPDFVPQCLINAYTTDKSEILLSMHGGEASGSYLTIFVFDKTGNLLKRIARQLSP